MVVSSNALLKIKKDEYSKLPPEIRTQQIKKLEKEITNLQSDIPEVNKTCFSLFKQLLHETIQKDWEKVILDQCYNKLGHISKGGKRTVPAKTR